MRESKAELTDRLRREGRWDAFVRRREVLKTEGVEAGEAWTMAAAEFPPATTPDAVQSKLSLTREALETLRGKPRVYFMEAIEWVCDHLDADWVQPSDDPDLQSWRLRAWARYSAATRTEFHRTFVVPLWKVQLERVENDLDYCE